jgi:group I intron endonuclease
MPIDNTVWTIYKVTNKVTGKIYIGQTILPVMRRWSDHCSLSKKKHRSALRAAIAKYGKESFNIISIEEVNSKDEVDCREKYWISFYNSVAPHGYNLELGGNGRGVVHQSTKNKISDWQKHKIKAIVYATNRITYRTSREAELLTGLSRAHILKCCNKNGAKAVGGHVFRFSSDWDGVLIQHSDVTDISKIKRPYRLYAFNESIPVGVYGSVKECAAELGLNNRSMLGSVSKGKTLRGYSFVKEII